MSIGLRIILDTPKLRQEAGDIACIMCISLYGIEARNVCIRQHSISTVTFKNRGAVTTQLLVVKTTTSRSY